MITEKKKEKKRKKVIIWHGKGTQGEINARVKAIESGKEPLPDGSDYSEKPDDYQVELLWEKITGYDYTKASKQLLDSKWRKITEDDLQRKLPMKIEKGDVAVAIQGGLGALAFDVLESQILHAFQTIFSKADYPLEMKITRTELYDAMGLGCYVRDGKKRYLDGPRGYKRTRIHETILGIARKTYLFMFSQEYLNSKNQPRYRMGLTYEPIMRILAVYEDVRQLELEGMETILKEKRDPLKKRFSHYKARFNPHAIGEIDKYFRYLPSGFVSEIMEYQKAKGGKASKHEITFIEYLYTESKERIEINYLKLAEKMRIKQLQDKKKMRRILNRCYETARDLDFLLKFETDQPGLRAKKDVFHLNPSRFKYLKGVLLKSKKDVT